MSAPPDSHPHSPLDADYRAIVGEAHATSAPDELHRLSHDLFTDPQQPSFRLALRPTTAAEVVAILTLANRRGDTLGIRGGGMSYTDGYAPAGPGRILLDLGELRGIRQLSTEDRFVVVEAGCTWSQVAEALHGTGLRTILRGPISGSVSTVGGAVSQNVPGSLDGVIGLELVTADGTLRRTGSYAAHGGHAFYRHYGPDLTGLFLGDNGIFGVKTAIVLRLEPTPPCAVHRSFGFDSMEDVTAAMVAVAASGAAARLFGLDPLKSKGATRVDVREGLATLKDVARSAPGGLGKGLLEAARIGIGGKEVYRDVEWSLHVTAEGHSQPECDAAVAGIEAICLAKGTGISNAIPVAMQARPFSIRGSLGPAGERWVPMHGIFPFSARACVVAATEAFFSRHAATLQAHRIVHSFMLSAGPACFLVEPMFYWQDELLPLHHAMLGEKAKSFGPRAADPAARAVVRTLRVELRDLYHGLGGISTQVGKFYRLRDALAPETVALIDLLKAALDRGGILNDGNLGAAPRLAPGDRDSADA